MSSILKEPYQISVWEDELVPEIVEYYKEIEEGKIETITSEEYNDLPSDEEKQQYTQKIIREHFEESRGLIIGANDMDSPYAAVNSSLQTNVNGSTNLTFTMYYKVFDPDVMDFVINPLAAAVLNERKIKLYFRGKWYDMVIKNCVEDSTAYSFTYTCSDIYINELSKNGFKVELDAELENNQGTVTKVAETILEGTDWHVAPIEEEAPEDYTGPYSDVIVQTNIEPIYQGILNQTIEVELVNDFTPDEYANMSIQLPVVENISDITEEIEEGKKYCLKNINNFTSTVIEKRLYIDWNNFLNIETIDKEPIPFSSHVYSDGVWFYIYGVISENSALDSSKKVNIITIEEERTMTDSDYYYSYLEINIYDDGEIRGVKYSYTSTNYDEQIIDSFSELPKFVDVLINMSEYNNDFQIENELDNKEIKQTIYYYYDIIKAKKENENIYWEILPTTLDCQVNKIIKNEKVYMFYSDISKNATQPQILYRPDDCYSLDINEDIITNAYNYRVISPEVLYVDKASSYDVPNIFYSENDSSFEICDWARGEKVIRSAKTGYDPDLDQFITVYRKQKVDDTGNVVVDTEGNPIFDYYYGYTTLDSISSDLAMNYLANSDNFIGIDSGWIFDGTPTTMDDAGDGTTVTGTNPNSEDATFTGQIYLLNQEGFSYDAANEGGVESVLVMKLEADTKDNKEPHYYRDNNGDFYGIQEADKDEKTYIKIDTPKADAYEAQITATYKQLRAQGMEDFAEMSDDELQRAIDSALRNARYSTRIRRAVNTGIAANRKQIENFSESEEYIFAVSLGQYKEGDLIPEYGHEIKYGAKTPTELYTFEDVTDSEAILKKVREEAYTQAVAEIKNHPTRFLNTDEYGNITDEIYLKAYNNYLAEKEAEYTAIYLDDFGLLKNLMHRDTIDKNDRGGKKFREVFKNALTNISNEVGLPQVAVKLLQDCKDLKTISLYYITNEKTVDVKIGDQIQQVKFETYDYTTEEPEEGIDYTKKQANFVQHLYECLKEPFFTQGWAIAEAEKQNAENKPNSFVWAFTKSSWEQSGNDGTFPELKIDQPTFTSEDQINSFCDALYITIVKSIYDKYIEVVTDTNEDGTKDDVSIAVIVPTVEEISKLIEDVFDELVDRVGLLGALKAAYEYKKPSILNPKGGDKYQQHRAQWEKDGHQYALRIVLKAESFASKYSYGTPKLDENGKVVQDDKTTGQNEFGGQDEILYLTEIEKLRIEKKKEFDESCSPAYIDTADYYKQLDDRYQNTQTEYDDSEKWEEYTEIEHICGWGFTSLYLKYKEAEFNEAAQVATFTISREEYPINSDERILGRVKSPIIPKQNDDGKWDITHTYFTDSGPFIDGVYPKYIAYEDDEKGYYVFDKKTEKIRLFDPEVDSEKATYLPIKNNKGGAYIYDDVRQVYRKYRDWPSTEYRNPKTKEFLEQIKGGVAGDIIHHEAQMFDGHLGDYEEIPTRYDMVRTFEDEDERAYLTEDSNYVYNLTIKKTWRDDLKEFFDFDWDFEADDETTQKFTFTLPAGHQLDYFYEDEDGFYVKQGNNEEPFEEFNNKVKNFFKGIGDSIEDTWMKIKDFFVNLFGVTTIEDNGEDVGSAFEASGVDQQNNKISKDFIDFNNESQERVYKFAKTFFSDEVQKAYKAIKYTQWWLSEEEINKRLLMMGFTQDEINNAITEISIMTVEDNTEEELGAIEQSLLSVGFATDIIVPLAEALNIPLSHIGFSTKNITSNEADFMENKPYFFNHSCIYRAYINTIDNTIISISDYKKLDKEEQSKYIQQNISNEEYIAISDDEKKKKYLGFVKPTLNIDTVNNLENLKVLLSKGFLKIKREDDSIQLTAGEDNSGEITTDDNPLVSDNNELYVKYRWWYWRHWGRKRYNLKEKLCIPAKNGSDEEYKVYNNIHDAVSRNYNVIEYSNELDEVREPQYVLTKKLTEEDFEKLPDDKPAQVGTRKLVISQEYYDKLNPEQQSYYNPIAFFLRDKTISYRAIEDTDYSPYAFDMIKDNEMNKNHVVRNDYYNYYRPYQDGDAYLKLFDGHFGYWCQTYEPVQLPKDGDKNNAWMLIGGKYIPYDIRLYNAGMRQFRRVRSTSNYSSLDEHLDDLFTYCNGEYISLREYYEKNTKISHLNYNGLKVYFTPHYEYNPEHFSLEVNQEPYDEYLGLQIETEPEGYFDTTVLNNTIIEEEVKERWGYWKIGVNKGYSLTDDLLSSIGIVFEKAKDAKRPPDKNDNDEDFAFLGMQLFRYIPYRSNKREEISELIDEIRLTFKQSDEGIWILESDKNSLQEKIEDAALPKISIQSTDVNILKQGTLEFYKYLQDYLDTIDYYLVFGEEKLKLYLTEEELNKEPEEGEQRETQEDRDEYIKGFIEVSNNKAVTFCDLYKTKYEEVRRPIIPGEAPDARDLTLTEYYIYDPEREENDKPETAIFDYKGQYPEEAGYEVVYDELCQKIRSIKGKEQNYFKLLQDCCDTFDCWMEVIVEHNPETGRVEYEERKVYTKISDEVDPQQYFDSLPEGEEEADYTVEYMIVPKKTIRFKRFVGKENWSGFKYGVNLKHIKRTLDSNQIATRIIVKPNKNEFATDGFCTIQRADENFIKENFIYDFSYYINKKMLKYDQVLQDLYTDVGSNLGYYRKLGRLNKENDQLIIDIASVIVELDKVKADYETAVLGRDAANEEIQKLMQILTSNYDTYGNIQFIPWEYNRAKEYEQKTSTTAPARSGVTIDGPDGQYVVDIPKITTELEYPKYNETLRTYFDQMDTYMRSHTNFSKQVEDLGKRKQELEEKRDKLLALEQEIIAKKKELNKIFFIKYARFIQEGSWVDEKYMDDNLYYLDSLAVLRNSCSPKVTYDIGVVDLYAAIEFEEDRPVLEFELGDRTYVEDVEFFGYAKNDKPYQEQIVISEKIYMLDDASQNQIKVKNYSTQFDNLFQRAAAATQTLQFNEGSYGRASTILNSDGTINQNVLQQSVTDANLILANSLNENVLWDNTGITVTSYSQRSNVIKIVSAGIMLSKDGGNSYLTAITGDGVNAAVITGGMLNVDKLMIGASSTPNFLWNRTGISTFKTSDEGIDYSTFVRLDQYGIYGIKNWSKNDIPIDKMTINDTFEPLKLEDIINNNNAIFGLTWDGFFLNTNANGGRGRVTIGTQQDIRMSVFEENDWQDRVIIGRMSDILTGEQTYGFRLINEDGEIVMDTNLRGELYLKRKLRISSFMNETTFDQQLKYDEEGNIVREEGKEGQLLNTDDRVTLGIVDIYNREDLSIANPSGLYNSAEYLTKVFSIKVNNAFYNDGQGEQFTGDQIKRLIANNETFAIFDNGNLYAKNAWIEGHIQATSGEFTGKIIATEGEITGTLIVGREDNTISAIKAANNNWSINGDGTAFFKNAVVSGKISTAIFEKQKIQVVGGTLMVAPQLTTKEVKHIRDSLYKITCEETTIDGKPTSDFSNGSICKISNTTTTDEDIIFEMLWEEPTEQPLVINNTLDQSETEINTEEKNITFYAIILNNETNDKLIDENKQSFVFCLSRKQDSELKPTTMLGLSGRDSSSVLPEESFSIFENVFDSEHNTYSTNIKAKFGKLGNEVPLELQGTYGLYSDNVYLKGTLITQNNNTEAGVSTNNYKVVDNRNLVFWAGDSLGINFSVTDDGTLLAKKGIFEGEVRASLIQSSEIKTSKVTGFDFTSGTTGLIFDGNGSAIRFINETQELFNLSTNSVEQTIDSKVFNYSKTAPLTFGVLNEEQIIGLFGLATANTVNDFGMSIKQNSKNEVEIYYKGMLQMTLSSLGVNFGENQLNSSLGEKVYSLDSIHDNVNIGCDIYVES